MNLRATLLILLAAIGVACSSASGPTPRGHGQHAAPPADADAAPAPTTAERALATHGERLRDGRGVVAVDIAPSGEALQVTLCAAEAAATLDTRDVEVPVATVVGAPADVTARGEVCGCVHDGAYLATGESYKVECNTCTCSGGGNARCTLLGCEIAILDKVFFAAGSATVDARAHPLLDAIAAVLAEHGALRLRVVGHAVSKEKRPGPLSERRASAVRAYLVTKGVAADRLELLAAGADRPTGEGAASDRRVSFEVIAGAYD